MSDETLFRQGLSWLPVPLRHRAACPAPAGAMRLMKSKRRTQDPMPGDLELEGVDTWISDDSKAGSALESPRPSLASTGDASVEKPSQQQQQQQQLDSTRFVSRREQDKALMTPYLRRIMKRGSTSAGALRQARQTDLMFACTNRFKDPDIERAYIYTRGRVTATAKSVPLIILIVLIFLCYYLVKGLNEIRLLAEDEPSAAASGALVTAQIYYGVRIGVFAVATVTLMAVICVMKRADKQSTKGAAAFAERHFSTVFAALIFSVVAAMICTTGYKVYSERRLLASDLSEVFAQAGIPPRPVAFVGLSMTDLSALLKAAGASGNATTAEAVLQAKMNDFQFKHLYDTTMIWPVVGALVGVIFVDDFVVQFALCLAAFVVWFVSTLVTLGLSTADAIARDEPGMFGLAKYVDPQDMIFMAIFGLGVMAIAHQVNTLKRLGFLYRVGIERENNSLKSDLKLLLGETSAGIDARLVETRKDRVMVDLLTLQSAVQADRSLFRLVNSIIVEVANNENLSSPQLVQSSYSCSDPVEKAYFLRITESFKTIREEEQLRQRATRADKKLDKSGNSAGDTRESRTGSMSGGVTRKDGSASFGSSASGGGGANLRLAAGAVVQHTPGYRPPGGSSCSSSSSSSSSSPAADSIGSPAGGAAAGTAGEALTLTPSAAGTPLSADPGMDRFGDWDFDPLPIHERTNGRSLRLVAARAVRVTGVLSDLRVGKTKFNRFVAGIEDGYIFTNPYHNSAHAADVEGTLSQLQVFATIVAAAIHDFRHPGRSNYFLVVTHDDVALRYNDAAVLENFHVAEAYLLCKRNPSLNIFGDLTSNQRSDVRQMIIELVLATDLKTAFGFHTELKTAALTDSTADFRAVPMNIMRACIKAADVGHPAKARQIHMKWTALVVEEAFLQGDEERRLGIQVSFLNFLIRPLFKELSAVWEPVFASLHTQVEENFEHWDALRHKGILCMPGRILTRGAGGG
eukprot:g3775.t1